MVENVPRNIFRCTTLRTQYVLVALPKMKYAEWDASYGPTSSTGKTNYRKNPPVISPHNFSYLEHVLSRLPTTEEDTIELLMAEGSNGTHVLRCYYR